LGNYPNPFKPAAAGRGPATEIRFQLSDVRQFERTQIEIFNIRGQKVKELKADMSSRPIRQLPERGEISYSTTWDGTDSNGTPVAGGVYLYQLKADGKALGQSKMLLLK
jgi:flagellar hook assembly protein FlgD